jgi:hypothetical protein
MKMIRAKMLYNARWALLARVQFVQTIQLLRKSRMYVKKVMR